MGGGLAQGPTATQRGQTPSSLLTNTGWSQKYCVPSISTTLRRSYHTHTQSKCPQVPLQLGKAGGHSTCPTSTRGTKNTPREEGHPSRTPPHSPGRCPHYTLPRGSRTGRQVLIDTCQRHSRAVVGWHRLERTAVLLIPDT